MEKKTENNFKKERIQLLQEQKFLGKELNNLETIIQAQTRKNEIRERLKEIEERLLEITCQWLKENEKDF